MTFNNWFAKLSDEEWSREDLEKLQLLYHYIVFCT